MAPAMTQNPTYDVCAVGNAIVDVLAPCDTAFLEAQGLTAGSMQLVDARQSAALYDAIDGNDFVACDEATPFGSAARAHVLKDKGVVFSRWKLKR